MPAVPSKFSCSNYNNLLYPLLFSFACYSTITINLSCPSPCYSCSGRCLYTSWEEETLKANFFQLLVYTDQGKSPKAESLISTSRGQGKVEEAGHSSLAINKTYKGKLTKHTMNGWLQDDKDPCATWQEPKNYTGKGRDSYSTSMWMNANRYENYFTCLTRSGQTPVLGTNTQQEAMVYMCQNELQLRSDSM